MAIRWHEQVCLLTGASGGIGSAIAHRLAGLGVRLILVGRNTERLAVLLEALPGQHRAVSADISNSADRDRIFNVCQEMGLTMLVNNAGVSAVGDFHGVGEDALTQLMNINLLAPMALTHRLLPLLRRADKAIVVNVGSAFGSIGFPCHATYCASKFGLRGWTESLMREYSQSNLSFFYLAPRATNTAINQQNVVAMNKALGNQMDSPETVADALVSQLDSGKKRWFIGSPEKWFARINGTLPELVDRALIKKLKTIRKFVGSVKEEKLS